MKRSDVEKFAMQILPFFLAKTMSAVESPDEAISHGVDMAITAAVNMVDGLDLAEQIESEDFDDAPTQNQPIDVGGAKVYKGPLSE